MSSRNSVKLYSSLKGEITLKSHIDEKYKIAEIKLGNITYVIPGGFNAAPYSAELGLWEHPRASSFKGIWRWWLRALLGGALWESGRYNSERVRQATENLLGSTSQASKFIIQVTTKLKKEPKCIPEENIRKWRRREKDKKKRLRITPKDLFDHLPKRPKIPPIPPRLYLLLMADEKCGRLTEKLSCYDPNSLEIELKILQRPYTRVSSEERRTAIASLLLSIALGGIGAITRRGFGSLKIAHIEVYREDLRKYETLVNNRDGMFERLRRLIESALSDAQALLKVKGYGESSNEIPPHPLLSKPGAPPEDVRPFNLRLVANLPVPNVTDTEKEAFEMLGFHDYKTMKLLTIIGYSTTKLFWKLVDRRKYIECGFKWHTWVMGLPRSGRSKPNENRIETGYLSESCGRRISAISIKPIKCLNKSSWDIILYGFLSKDWPETLHYHSVKKGELKKKEINPRNEIRDKFVEAWGKLKKLYGW